MQGGGGHIVLVPRVKSKTKSVTSCHCLEGVLALWGRMSHIMRLLSTLFIIGDECALSRVAAW